MDNSLVQAVTSQKYGSTDLSAFATKGTKDVRSYLAGAEMMRCAFKSEGFDLAWNYIVALKPGAFDFAPLASCIPGKATKWGHRDAFVGVSTPYEKDYADWNLADFPSGGGPTEQAVEALLLGNMESLQGSRAKLVLGHYSEKHGPVHTGRLTIHVDQGGYTGFAILEISGDWNELSQVVRIGPYSWDLEREDKPPILARYPVTTT
ncbi:MAG: hypothetical protein JRH20_24685 [Deltaproteobacteria bacterium]|nr:hypothetical protein [Deltaproteobacteria bacterium]